MGSPGSMRPGRTKDREAVWCWPLDNARYRKTAVGSCRYRASCSSRASAIGDRSHGPTAVQLDARPWRGKGGWLHYECDRMKSKARHVSTRDRARPALLIAYCASLSTPMSREREDAATTPLGEEIPRERRANGRESSYFYFFLLRFPRRAPLFQPLLSHYRLLTLETVSPKPRWDVPSANWIFDCSAIQQTIVDRSWKRTQFTIELLYKPRASLSWRNHASRRVDRSQTHNRLFTLISFLGDVIWIFHHLNVTFPTRW